METQHNPFPDFNIQRKCVDWEGITEYLKNAELPGFPERHSHMERPKDAVQIPVLKQLAELSRLQKNETEGSTTDHDHHHR
jgi:hypothetical protein